MRTLVIAEAGVNHGGDRDIARRLIDVAAAAGADVVKFQTFRATHLVTRAACLAPYQARNLGTSETQFEMIRRLELDAPAHEALILHCRTAGIRFLSTPFDQESADLLVGLGVDVLKIPSGEITNLPYLRHLGAFSLPVVLSTGMATLGEVEAAVDALVSAGVSRHDLTLLHCTTDYPTAPADVNLRAMVTMRDAFKVAVGYSDHTLGITMPVAAVALGATVIEKHFTLNRADAGPDHAASLEPAELAAMVRAIRDVETALGDGLKRPSTGELANRPVARKSLVAATSIRQGEVYGLHNLAAKRPGTGVSPMRWDDVVGRRAPRDFAADEPIEL